MYVIVVFGGPVYPVYSHHMYVIVVFGGPLYPVYSHHMYVIVDGINRTTKNNNNIHVV
jgi:pantothenate kinase